MALPDREISHILAARERERETYQVVLGGLAVGNGGEPT